MLKRREGMEPWDPPLAVSASGCTGFFMFYVGAPAGADSDASGGPREGEWSVGLGAWARCRFVLLFLFCLGIYGPLLNARFKKIKIVVLRTFSPQKNHYFVFKFKNQ